MGRWQPRRPSLDGARRCFAARETGLGHQAHVLEAADDFVSVVKMKFFTDHDIYQAEAHQWLVNRLNERYNHIIVPNIGYIAGKRILDLGAYDGRWTWACLESGAAFVTAIEARATSVASGRQSIPQLEQDFLGCYEFLIGDVFQLLPIMRPFQFDTILCLGLFYHVLNHERLIGMMARLKPEAIILDSGLLDTDEMIIRLAHEPTSHRMMGIGPSEQTLVGMPSRGALAAIARLHRLQVDYVPWIAEAISDHNEIEDYMNRERFTCVLTSDV